MLIVIAYHAFSVRILAYLIPVFLVSAPYFSQGTINLRYSSRITLDGFIASAAILTPFWVILTVMGIPFTPPPLGYMPVQLFLVSFPEEAFFRGFLQQRLGNNLKGIVMVSALFAGTHLPGFLLHGNIYSILTFFPSLVMGYLYMRSVSILPATIFHFFANTVFLGFSH